MNKYCFAIFALFIAVSAKAQQKHLNLLIGTYTKTCESKGIYCYSFNTETGEAKQQASTENVVNPSYLALSPNKKIVYSVNEDGNSSKASAFKFDAHTSQFEALNSQPSMGNDPCYILNDDYNILVANYSGGNITVYGKNPDGSIGKFKQVMAHENKATPSKEAKPAHMHMVQFTPDKKYVIASDLGNDKLYVYKYNPKASAAVLQFHSFVMLRKGSGPRHFTFSPDGKLFYVINELDGSLVEFKYKNEELIYRDDTTVVDSKFKSKPSAADIHISSDGKYLYATNRGDANTITCFEITKTGRLKLKQTISTLGKGPRNFALDPTGNFLLIAHQYSNNVVVFKIDKTTGLLTDSGKRIELCSPVCLVFE